MRKIALGISVAVGLTCIFLNSGCSLFDTAIHPTKFEFDEKDITIQVGAQTTATLQVEPQNAVSHASFDYSASDSSVVSLSSADNTVIITGLKPGLVVVKGSSQEMSGSYANIQVTVVAGDGTGPDGLPGGATPFVSVSANPNISIAQAAKSIIQASLVNGSEVDQQQLTWSIDRPDIATVFGSGSSVQLSGITNGQAVITVTHPKSQTSGKIYVTVGSPTNTTGSPYLSTSQTVFNLVVGDNRTIGASLANALPQDQSNISWSSDNSSVVSVFGQGSSVQFKANTAGSTSIHATHPKSVNSLTFWVTVSQTASGQEIYLTTSQSYLTLTSGASASLNAQLVGGSTPDNYGITWTMQDNTVASVLGSGSSVQINALSAGETILMISHPKSLNVLYITVQVTAINKVISLSTTYLNLNPSQSKQLSATITLGDQSDYNGISWAFVPKQGDPVAASIAGSGKTVNITGITDGQGTITATLTNGSSAQCSVTVVTAASFNLLSNSASLEPQTTKTIAYVLTPQSAPMTITVSDPSVASVTRLDNTTLNITGISEGSTSVYLIAQGLTQTLDVNVRWQRTFTLNGPANVSGTPGQTYRINFAMHPTTDPISVTSNSNANVASAYIDTANSQVVIQALNEGVGSIGVKGAGIQQSIAYQFAYTYAMNISTSTITQTPDNGVITRDFTYSPANGLIQIQGLSTQNAAATVSYANGSGTLSISPIKEGIDSLTIRVYSAYNSTGNSASISVDTRYSNFAPDIHFSRDGGWASPDAIADCFFDGTNLHFGDGQQMSFWVTSTQKGVQINSVSYTWSGLEATTDMNVTNNRLYISTTYGIHDIEEHGVVTVTINWGPDHKTWTQDFKVYTVGLL